jgi:hypothetical protein
MAARLAPAPASPVEVHHGIPRCLLRLRDRADAAGFTGEGIELAMDYEHEAMRWGVDPDISREELAALVEDSTAEVPRQEHRAGHAEDFARWGRLGGLRTLALYGAPWYSLLALRRWEKVGAEALSESLAAMRGGRS